MPNKFCAVAQIVGDRVPSVVIAVTAGKDNDTESHYELGCSGDSLFARRASLLSRGLAIALL